MEKIIGGSALIQVKDLVKQYRGITALDGVSFCFDKGGIHGILGASGAGKSTLLNIICSCLGESSGEVFVDGVSIKESPNAAKKKIGYLPEIPPLYSDMTAYEYLIFVAEAKSVPYDKLYKNVKSAVELTGLEGVEHKVIKNLSAEHKVCVGIAQTLLGNPDVIILDEPFAKAGKSVMAELTELIKRLSGIKTVVLASSDYELIESVCDDIVILSRGKVVAFDTVEELHKRLGRTKTLKVSLRGSESSVITELSAISAITDCTVVSAKSGVLSLRLEYEQDSDVRDEVFAVFAKAGMPILSMDVEALSLRDIFAKLSENESASRPVIPDKKKAKNRRKGV